MALSTIEDRRTIEALRSGVPSDAAVRALGTTQREIVDRFTQNLRSKDQGVGAQALVIDANFGDGKSHLLQFLRVKAESEGYATSSVVVGPDTPIGNAHLTLKSISEQARVPGRTGKALIELSSSETRNEVEELRLWARDAEISDRFRALLRVYEATKDDELRVQILGDFEGKPLIKSILNRELRSLGELSHYDLKSPRSALLAHDRIKILAQFCRSHGHFGLVVFFDELERISNFGFRARLAAYEEVGWWRRMCESVSIPILAVFTQTTGSLEQCLVGKGDEGRLQGSLLQEARDDLALAGIDLLRRSIRLEKASRDDLETLQHGLRETYRAAYGVDAEPIALRTALTTVRSEIRRWITEWDLARHFPGYRTTIETEEVAEDTDEIPEELMPPVEGE